MARLFLCLVFLLHSTFLLQAIQQLQSNAYYTIAYSTPSASIPEYSLEYGICSCDVTFNACDANCCCDTDCSQSDLNSFTECSTTTAAKATIFEQRCMAQPSLYYVNAPSQVKVSLETTPNPIFCVYYDNGILQGRFFASVSEYSLTQINSLLSQYKSQVLKSNSLSFNSIYDATVSTTKSVSYYLYNDTIPVLRSSSSQTTFLKLPSAIFSSHCEEAVSVRFLNSVTNNFCEQSIQANLEAVCNTSLNVVTYTTDLFVSTNSYNNFTIPILIQSITTLFYNSTTKLFTPITTTSSTSFTGLAAPISQYDSTNLVCRNALQKLTYNIYYTENKISSIRADVTILDTTSPFSRNILQSFNTLFLNNGTETAVPKSGNPGYMTESPLLAGTLSPSSSILRTVQGLQVLTGLSCYQQESLTVKFNVNQVSACRLQLTRLQLKSICQAGSLNSLTNSTFVDRIGRYGNANVNRLSDWIIVQTEPASIPIWDEPTGTCYNFPGIVQYDIITAQSGLVSNVQMVIVGAKKSYAATTWKYDTSLTTNQFYLQFRVEFYLATNIEQTLTAQIPNFLPFLPTDIFYPFHLVFGTASNLSISPLLIIVTLFAVLF